MPEPRFAVVGHPNKGKSSIVATLAADPEVRVAPTPGTTTRSREFPMSVDGRTLYTLIDTPGFQRARRVLAWMAERDTTADRRADVVRDFVDTPGHDRQFPDEVELLRPIVDDERPTGILYVVDGSVPYGPEYEAEMEILRWTGRPSLALINPIGEADHVEAWRAALGQYFRIVRTFNAVTAEFDKRLELLRAFGQMAEGWREPLDEAVAALDADRDRRRRESAREIARLLIDAVTLEVSEKIGPKDDPKPVQPKLMEKYQGELRRRERRCRERVEAIYGHAGLDRRGQEEGGPDKLLDADLFSQETWLLFGLRRRDLVVAGAAGGGVAGGALDVAAGGTSLFLGAAIGAAVGGTMGWLGASRVAEFKVLNQPLGGRLVRCGPTRSVNFPFVLLGRARHHHAVVAGRTHAQRGALELDEAKAGAMNPLTDTQRQTLAKAFRRLPKVSGDLDEVAPLTEAVTDTVAEVLADGSV
ncbi:MAG: GTPase/DUF3482 domain-containing protein [Planctomycetota bacterium]